MHSTPVIDAMTAQALIEMQRAAEGQGQWRTAQCTINAILKESPHSTYHQQLLEFVNKMASGK